MNNSIKNKNIKADFEHLKKLFIFPDSHDKFLEFGYELLEMIYSFFKDTSGIHSTISLSELGKMFSQYEIPESPHLLKDIFPEIKNKIIAHSVKVGSPYYIGHMTSAVPYFTILVEMIIAALNQNQVKIETAKASTFVERELLAWIHRLIYDKPARFYKENIQNHKIALGNVTLDGTLANMTAILVARNKAFAADNNFPGIDKAGIAEAYNYYKCHKAVIIISKRGHYSFDKIARNCGIGDDNVIKIPVASDNKIDIHELRKVTHEIEAYNARHNKKIKIISLVGIAGTTETGNIDNLYELHKHAVQIGTHFHVDAAWGGPVLFVDQYRHLFKGIELADSVTFDSHKLLYSPLSMGMILFRDKNDLNYLKHTSTYILRPESRDQGRFTVEGSRPFSSLKPWVTFKVFGSEGFKLLFENAFKITSILRSIIETHSNFELMNYPELFIINYRFVPLEIQTYLEELVTELSNHPDDRLKLDKALADSNQFLNEMNIALHRSIRQEDNSFVSRTALESTRYRGQDIIVLRSVTINPLTTPEMLKEIISEQDRLGSKIYKNMFENVFKKINGKSL